MSDYIPPELIRRILIRLPVESLLRCTTVCKSWYDLITSSSFISSHLNTQEPRILISHKTRDLSSYSVYRDNQTFDKIADLYPPLGNPTDPYLVIDGFNGLYCLFDCLNSILLWNPAIRKSLELFPKPRVDSYCCVGFCFLPTINDYKVVRVSYQGTEGSDGGMTYRVPPDVEIYELKINSWRSIDAQDFQYCIPRIFKKTVLNCIVHWVAYDPKIPMDDQALLGSFDMKSEKFGALILPDCFKGWMCTVYPYTLRESLCLVRCNKAGGVSVWVMKEYGVADSWENLYNFDTGRREMFFPYCFRENEDILLYNIDRDPYPFVSCDLKKNEMKIVKVTTKPMIYYVESYVESLVLIKSLNQVLESRCEDEQDEVIKNV